MDFGVEQMVKCVNRGNCMTKKKHFLCILLLFQQKCQSSILRHSSTKWKGLCKSVVRCILPPRYPDLLCQIVSAFCHLPCSDGQLLCQWCNCCMGSLYKISIFDLRQEYLVWVYRQQPVSLTQAVSGERASEVQTWPEVTHLTQTVSVEWGFLVTDLVGQTHQTKNIVGR